MQALSIIIVSFNDAQRLRGCLGSLAPQIVGDIEVIVVRNRQDADDVRAQLRHDFPAVRWVDAPPETTVPVMRAIGITASQGGVVALLEDDVTVAVDWVRATLNAHKSEDVAIGGAVEPGPYTRGLDWAVYFCEYGRFMQPLPE